MNANSFRGRAVPVAALLLALIAVVAVVASGALGRAGDPADPIPSASPTPTSTPTSTPTRPAATPTPRPTPTAEPTESPADGNFEVDLDTVDDHDITILVDDATGTIVKVASGTPGDGMSVRWFDMKVENVDARTLRFTWVGLPVDEQIDLSVARDGGKLRLRFVQAAPPANSDAMGHDRELLVTFDEPVAAEDIAWSFEEGPDQG
jgi:hypothetical protein